MLNQAQAADIALKEILKRWDIEGDEPVLIEDDTLQEDFGWVFFYESRIFLETQIFSYCLAGNAPIIVNKNDGSVFITGTARPVEDYIEEYRRKLLKK